MLMFKLRTKWVVASAYIVAAVFGLSTILWPPVTIEGTIGIALTYLYGAFAFIGGITSLVGLLKPNYRLEWTSLWFVAGAFAAYDVAVWSIVVGEGNLNRVPQATAILLVSILLLERVLWLGGQNKKLVEDAVARDVGNSS